MKNSKIHTVTIESIDLDGKGVSHVDGKVVFINQVLPTEIVEIEITKQKSNHSLAKVLNILHKSDKRVTPPCPNYAMCGGCSWQHIDIDTQIIYKQQILLETLQHIGNVTPNNIIPPLTANSQHYRHRARLSVRFVHKKDKVLVGFRERDKPYVVDMQECLILPIAVSELLLELQNLIITLDIKTAIPQIEVANGDNLIVLLIRVMVDKLSDHDTQKMIDFVDNYNNGMHINKLQIWLQTGGLDSVKVFYPTHINHELKQNIQLQYSLPELGIVMPYYPTEFTQINPAINQAMVKSALEFLNLTQNDKIIDFFCGIGNFTIAIAKTSGSQDILGIEGSSALTTRAKENAILNNIHNIKFLNKNLFEIDEEYLLNLGYYNKWLLDPPRDGCFQLVKSITPASAAEIIVYISCNPATLARDLDVLVHQKNYTLLLAGVMDMFPHTAHVESIALFEK